MAAADYRLLTEATGVRIAEALEDVTAMVGPKGDTGATGPQGPAGPQGPKGDTGEVTQAEFDELKSGLSEVATWEGKYIVSTEVEAANTVLSFPVNIGASIFKRVLKIKDGGSGGYYGYALLKNQTQVWGIGTPESGLLYISSGATVELSIPNDIEADTFTFRNRNSCTGTTIEISAVGINYPDYMSHQSIYHYLRRIGIKPVGVDVMHGSGGATVDSTTKTITIPSGNTGYNSGFAVGLSRSEIKKVAYADKEAVFTLALKATISPEMLKPAMWYASRDASYTVVKLIGTCENDTYIYEMRFPLASSIGDSGNEVVYVQFKNEAALSDSKTIQFISGCLEWDSYDQSIIDGVKNVLATLPQETVITVGTGKDYTSLRSALEYAATIASQYNHVTVQYFGLGETYDVMDDITSADLETTSTWPGLSVPGNCKLLGMGSREQNKISLELPSGTASDICYRISTINLYENAELENLWFIGNNCRYACHDDMMEANPTWTLKTVKNCRFTSDHTNQGRAYGAGYKSGVNWRFENCIFEQVVESGESYPTTSAFSAHNNNAMEKAANLTFVNCQFIGGKCCTFESLNRVSGQSYPNAKSMISFYGCKGIHYRWEAYMFIELGIQGTNSQLEVCVTGFGNNFDESNVYVWDGSTDQTASWSDYITIWGKIATS